MHLILDVPLKITIELGYCTKQVKEILDLSKDSVIELDKKAGEPLDVLVNGSAFAQGEIVVIDDNIGVKITKLKNKKNR